MSSLPIAMLLAIAAFAGLLWLLRKGKRPAKTAGALNSQEITGSRPRHYRFFPQIRQALSTADEEYLRKKVPADIAQRVRRERRAVARKFLSGLREDFSNLEQMGRMIAALSPDVNHAQETERLSLRLKFQFLYALVWLSLSTGRMPLRQIEHLTGLVGSLALRMEQAMVRINALTPEQNFHGLNA
jgi:hypothetical protein